MNWVTSTLLRRKIAPQSLDPTVRLIIVIFRGSKNMFVIPLFQELREIESWISKIYLYSLYLGKIIIRFKIRIGEISNICWIWRLTAVVTKEFCLPRHNAFLSNKSQPSYRRNTSLSSSAYHVLVSGLAYSSKKAIQSSEILDNFQRTSQRYIPEDITLLQ